MYKITDIGTSGSGERLLLKISTPEGESTSVAISSAAYRKLELKKGEISEKTYEALISRADYEEALIRGMRILGYGANSPKQLEEKLCRAGVKRESAARVTRELIRRGYLNEVDDAWRIAEGLIEKRYGRRRIIASLRAKGYSEGALSQVDERLSEVDFVELCTEAARAKFKRLENDRTEVQKAIAKLMALGYNVNEAKSALTVILSERE